MSVICLDIENSAETSALVSICKSDSWKGGMILRDAHYQLGLLLSKQIARDVSGDLVSVVIMMRAGLCFGLGIADGLELSKIETRILFFQNEEQWKKEQDNCPHALHNTVILVDAVINSGKSILAFSKQLTQSRRIIFAANVLSEKCLENFEDKSVYVTRVSKNSFIGSKSETTANGKGPDTGDRLFNTM
jgi:uracil phosphoribosyltransferase